RADRERLPWPDQAGRGDRERALLRALPDRLGLEARLLGAVGRQHGTAVHLVHQAAAVELLQVPPDGHVGDVQQAGQVADPDPASAAYLVDDPGLSLAREHQSSPSAGTTTASRGPTRTGRRPTSTSSGSSVWLSRNRAP